MRTIPSFFQLAAIGAVAFIIPNCSIGQSAEPWTPEQLMPPAHLAEAIQQGEAADIHLFDLGPSGQIKGAVEIGEGKKQANIEKLRAALNELPQDAEVVIYCGCCPFKNCPNVRPAMELVNGMGFTNAHLLNLPENLKTDWIDKGYPMED